MNFSYYIASRLTFKSKKSFSRLIIRIGITGIAISIAVMLGSVAILTGFKKEITGKVIGFGSHVQVRALDLNETYEATPIKRRGDFLKAIQQVPGVNQVHAYAHKAAIIKTDIDVEGVVLKGVEKDYDWSFMQSNLVAGTVPVFNDSMPSDGIVLSKTIADRLRLKVGDKVPLYFIQEPVRVRALIISGIYETGLEEYDKTFAMVDLKHIQKLNSWGDSLVHGFEVTLKDFDEMETVAYYIDLALPPELKTYTAYDQKPQIFDWLGLLDTNVLIIMVLMILVASINMITALLVLIIERTNMIGILKALGSSNGGIRRIFLFKAAYLIIQGLAIGNLIGLGFLYYQQSTRFIHLDASSYYLSFVPVNLELWHVVLINAGAFVVCLLAMLLPGMLVTRITPVKAIRFE